MTVIVYPDADPTVLASLGRIGGDATLHQLGQFRVHRGDPVDEAQFLERVADAEIVLLGSNLPNSVLERAPSLRFISFTGYGAGNFVDLELAAARGIPVANTPGYGAASVAEHAVALALAVAHRIPISDAATRRANWSQPSWTQLAGRTAGIIGYGAIGARAASLFHGLGMEVLVHARRVPHNPPPWARFVALPDLLSSSDLVSLHLALTPETAGFLTAEHLAAIRPDGIVINTARAELVEPGALEAELASRRLRAGLDVFAREPVLPDSVIAVVPGTVLTPHQGYNSPEALDSLMSIAVDNIRHFLTGHPYHSA